MTRDILEPHLAKIEELSAEIILNVPIGDTKTTIFRADLAGLLVVAAVSTYEACVKDILINYANAHHPAFGSFATNNFAKLNSRIAIGDLNSYTKLCDGRIHGNFKDGLKLRRDKINHKIGKDIMKSYEQMLSWRHDFAHAWIRNTTVEEAMITHTLAKRVIYSFSAAFR